MSPLFVILLAPAAAALAMFFLPTESKRGVRTLAMLGTGK